MSDKARTLVIETASEACSIALFEGDKLLAHDHRVLGRGHAERLIPMIKALPGKGRADQIYTSLGPGSFTGVRIGIAAARALGVAWGAQVVGYPTLALIAQMALEQQQDSVTICMNGGHGEWFVEDFAADGMPTKTLASLTPDQAAERDPCPYIAGDRANELAARLSGDARVFETVPDARFALKVPPALLSQDLSPIYGRGPDAVPQAQAKPPS